MEEQKKSGFGIASLVLGIIGLLLSCCWIGIIPCVLSFIFSIISLCNKSYKKGMAIAGLVLSVIGFFIFGIFLILAPSLDNVNSLTTEEITTETTTESATEITTEEETTEISEEDFKTSAQEVSYEDIYRNPQTYKDKPIKITVYVDEYDTKYLGTVNVYYCTAEGNNIYLRDMREVEEPTIAKGDTVIIYGVGSGLVTLTESQKNILGITMDKEKEQIPCIDIKYAELK